MPSPVADLTPGVAVEVSALVRRVLAPNPGIMTGPGTNTYLVGDGSGPLAVIDPGPADDGHLDAVAAAGGGRIRWILATHTHADHSPGAAGLRLRTGATVYGYGPPPATARGVAGLEGHDWEFAPDVRVAEGWRLPGAPFVLDALHTPGHASNHLCFALADRARLLFSGDQVMSGSTVVIAPPDGDMAVYLESLERLRGEGIDRIAPGHGDMIEDPAAVLDQYLAHRMSREAAILAALTELGPAGIDQLVAAVYTDVPADRHPIARYSVWAHLRKLAAQGRVQGDDVDDIDAAWATRPLT
jgi:glyoxylase-like metal-dependent hydrolase (beta-lactamase superfamily II)